MEAVTLGLLVALTAVLVAEFINGWTDAPNAIATVVSTGVMAPRSAVLMAVILNFAGALAGTAVAATVGKGIVESSALNLPAITAAMIAIIVWGGIAAKIGMPISKSHALLAGLAGAGFAGGGFGALQSSGWAKVFLGMFCAIPFGFVASILLGKLIVRFAGQWRPQRAKKFFDRAQIVSAGFMAFNHGLNDGQKFMGVFALTLLLGGVTKKFEIPIWVMIICAATMGIGTAAGGWRIIETIGSKMTRIVSWQGFVAECSASTTIFVASMFGIPLSTTHTITSCIVGVGAARRLMDVRWGVLGRIFMAWVVTFPVCFIIAYIAALIANRLF
ncbi:MAG: inorganic phosphate transporter [Hyphomicrobiaceae bacterium]|nr:inorganic phosphate transporter [Hyphomicrobiaceae bacterium]